MTWAPDYCTVEELKAQRRISDNDDDDQIALAITASSRAIDKAANRQFGQLASAAARYYTAHWDKTRYKWVVPIDDLMSIAGFAIDYDSDDSGSFLTSITPYTLAPVNAASQGKPWTSLIVGGVGARGDAVRVTAKFGWNAVPDAIKQACLMQASRLLARRDSPFGVAGSANDGSELRLFAKLDPDVKVLVNTYYRWWGAV